ncbi:MAG: hypothetical protein ACO1N1_17720 [Dyadobacter fermentans]
MSQIVEYDLPAWLSAAFLLAIPAPVILTIRVVSGVFSASAAAKLRIRLTTFFVIYIVYVTTLGFAGAYHVASFPPRILLFTTFPFAIFLFLIVGRSDLYRAFLDNVSLYQLVQVHIFRLIGGFFILLVHYQALPQWFGLIAGSGDILTAVTGALLAMRLRTDRPRSRIWVWVWNTFGLIDILFTAISANILTMYSVEHGTMGVDALAVFPFYFIPALAPALIIFLHYTIYLKLRKGTKMHFLT